jgi:hypothetical protein
MEKKIDKAYNGINDKRITKLVGYYSFHLMNILLESTSSCQNYRNRLSYQVTRATLLFMALESNQEKIHKRVSYEVKSHE